MNPATCSTGDSIANALRQLFTHADNPGYRPLPRSILKPRPFSDFTITIEMQTSYDNRKIDRAKFSRRHHPFRRILYYPIYPFYPSYGLDALPTFGTCDLIRRQLYRTTPAQQCIAAPCVGITYRPCPPGRPRFSSTSMASSST